MNERKLRDALSAMRFDDSLPDRMPPLAYADFMAAIVIVVASLDFLAEAI